MLGAWNWRGREAFGSACTAAPAAKAWRMPFSTSAPEADGGGFGRARRPGAMRSPVRGPTRGPAQQPDDCRALLPPPKPLSPMRVQLSQNALITAETLTFSSQSCFRSFAAVVSTMPSQYSNLDPQAHPVSPGDDFGDALRLNSSGSMNKDDWVSGGNRIRRRA